MSRRGLPVSIAMRHDEHYVSALAASAGAPVGRMIGIDQVDPNPDQPRQVMGDLSELIASISEKGIIEPIVVRQRGEFQIVAGERRYQASVQAGLRELPVVIRDVDDTEVIEASSIAAFGNGGHNGNGSSHGRTVTNLSDAIAHFQKDAPSCPSCGHMAVRNGACYKCLNCGESLGCS